MKKIVATIEARMTSSRLPGKVLMPACGMPMLEILIRRLKKVGQVHEIVVATTINTSDDPVVALAEKMGVGCFRGSEEDVLARVLGAAGQYEADLIVEITGDCPLVDPVIVGQVIDLYLNTPCDYASNVNPVTFPIGMDAQVFSAELLARADREGKTREDREHVSWYIRNHPHMKRTNLYAPSQLHWPELGLTLDEMSDYELLKNIVEHFSPNLFFSCKDILDYLRMNPHVLKINQNVARR
ncbi:MAG: glycosyltransferase family protein [Candidatus Omnitrophica bacterium]|nr:glycosyltransferase family protein [Candidatus Omnitrophota bacterium]